MFLMRYETSFVKKNDGAKKEIWNIINFVKEFDNVFSQVRFVIQPVDNITGGTEWSNDNAYIITREQLEENFYVIDDNNLMEVQEYELKMERLNLMYKSACC